MSRLIVAVNRIGTEAGENSSVTFYGSSFIAGSAGEGELPAEADRSTESVITAELDLENIKAE